MLFTVLLRPTALELLPTTVLKSPWTLLHTPDTYFGTDAVRAGHFVVALAGHSRNRAATYLIVITKDQNVHPRDNIMVPNHKLTAAKDAKV